MNNKKYNYLSKIFISILILVFFLFNLKRIDYGLPYFLNVDESEFSYSTLAYLNFITGYEGGFDEPIYGSFLNLVFISLFNQ